MSIWSSPQLEKNAEGAADAIHCVTEGASSNPTNLVPDSQYGNIPFLQMGPVQLPTELSGIQLTMMEFSNTNVSTEGGGKMNTPPPESAEVGRPVRQCRQQRTTRFTPY